MNIIDHVYYINLDYRHDRRLQMEDWLDESGFPNQKVTRISAVQLPGAGHIGCLMSHIHTLKKFLESEYNTSLIFEDDYKPLDVLSFWSNFKKLQSSKIDYDIVMCAYNKLISEPTEFEWLHRVNFSYTSSGYLITRKFAPILIQNFTDAVNKIVEYEQLHKTRANDFCLDVYWQKLMPISKWYCFYPRIGKQIDSFSDIQSQYTTYEG
jgi:GR25 family glycosyltransferase involved in LPS biosynthesis